MYIPADIHIKSTLKPGVVYYFAHESFKVKYRHYFVVINSDPLSVGLVLLLCAVTLDIKVIERKQQLGHERGVTLFDTTPETCGIFRHPTLFDCNQVLVEPLSYFVNKVECGQLEVVGNIPLGLLYDLQRGVVASKLVERRLKKLISAHNYA